MAVFLGGGKPSYRVERTVILNDITQDKNKVLGDENNETVKFHRLVKSMKKSVSIFQSVLRRSNEMVYLSKNDPWQKSKTPPEGQIVNRVWIDPSIYLKEFKSIP